MTDIVSTMTPDVVREGIEANIRGIMAAFGHLPGANVEECPELMRLLTGIPFPLFNGIVGARLAGDTIDATIDSALAPFRERRVPMLWWVGPLSEPFDLGARLQAHGLTHAGEMPGMATDLDVSIESPITPQGLTIERVAHDASLRDYITALIPGYGLPLVAGEGMYQLCSLIGFGDDAPLHNFLAKLDGVPVATSLVALLGGVAGVWNVATVPEARRRGIGAAMTRAALAYARERGYHVGVLLSSTAGFNIYERLGFRTYCTVSQFILMPE